MKHRSCTRAVEILVAVAMLQALGSLALVQFLEADCFSMVGEQ